MLGESWSPVRFLQRYPRGDLVWMEMVVVVAVPIVRGRCDQETKVEVKAFIRQLSSLREGVFDSRKSWKEGVSPRLRKSSTYILEKPHTCTVY